MKLTLTSVLDGIEIMHTDIKLANVMLVDKSYRRVSHECGILSSSTTEKRFAPQRRVLVDTDIRLIDLGCAICDDDEHSDTVTEQYYRAPEILLK